MVGTQMVREYGFYWVKVSNGDYEGPTWNVGYFGWGGEHIWLLLGDEVPMYSDDDLDEIGPRILDPDGL